MSKSGLPQEAKSSAKAIIYQMCVAVEACYKMIDGQMVLIEELGDVTIEDQSQIEVKHYSDCLTDAHHNLWNTLKNWLDDKFDHTRYSALVLYTAQPFGKQAKISKWNISTQENRFEILKEIYNDTEKRFEIKLAKYKKTQGKEPPKPGEVLNLQRIVFKKLNEDKYKEVLNKIYIETSCPFLPELHKKLKAQWLKGILESKKTDFLNALIGFICQPEKENEQRWEISYSNFEKKVTELTQTYCKGTMIFPKKYFKNSPEYQDAHYEQHKEHTFVKKINEIKYKEVIPEAINDYMSTILTMHEEFRDYKISLESVKLYESELLRFFTGRYQQASRNSNRLRIIKDSKNFYDDITLSESFEFNGFEGKPPMAFRNGVIHQLLDDEKKKLYWWLKKK